MLALLLLFALCLFSVFATSATEDSPHLFNSGDADTPYNKLERYSGSHIIVFGGASLSGFHALVRLLRDSRFPRERIYAFDSLPLRPDTPPVAQYQRLARLHSLYNFTVKHVHSSSGSSSSGSDLCYVPRVLESIAAAAQIDVSHVLLLSGIVDLAHTSKQQTALKNFQHFESANVDCLKAILKAASDLQTSSSSIKSSSKRRQHSNDTETSSVNHSIDSRTDVIKSDFSNDSGDIIQVLYQLPELRELAVRTDEKKLPTLAADFYSQLAAAAMAANQQYKVAAVGLQAGNLYGSWDDSSSSLYHLATAAFSGSTSDQVSAVHALHRDFVSYTHVNDFIDGVVHLLDRHTRVVKSSFLTYSVASTTRSSAADVVNSLFDHTSLSTTTSSSSSVSPISAAEAASIRNSDDLTKAIKQASEVSKLTTLSASFLQQQSSMFESAFAVLHFAPRVDLRVGVQQFLDWFQEHESHLFPCASECVADETTTATTTTAGAMKPPALCFHSVWEAAAATSKQLTAGCANVFYTVAIDSRVDYIHDLPQFWNHDPQQPQLHCNIAFVNRGSVLAQHQQQPQLQQESVDHFEYRNWSVVLVDEFETTSIITSASKSATAAAAVFSDPRKPTRVPKLSPSRFFAASARYAVYMDSKLRIACDPREYVLMMDADSLALLAVRISEHEDGIFYHIDHVLDRLEQRPSITFYPKELRRQRDVYEAYSQLLNVKYLNIFDGAFMVHDLRSEAAKRFRCDWYREYQQWSDRDQVAAAYVLTMRALAMHSNATNWRNNFIPIGIDASSSDDSSSSSADSGLSDHSSNFEHSSEIDSSKFDHSSKIDSRKFDHSSNVDLSKSDHWSKSDYSSFAYSREELNHHPYDSSNDRERYNYYQGNVRFVRLLPRYEYHWTKNPGKIGREELFDWNRLDDSKGIIPPEVRLAEHLRRQQLKADRKATQSLQQQQQQQQQQQLWMIGDQSGYFIVMFRLLMLLLVLVLLYKLQKMTQCTRTRRQQQ